LARQLLRDVPRCFSMIASPEQKNAQRVLSARWARRRLLD
jgi:hypothetical protein